SRSYDLLSAGFSRSREYLADRMACALVGSEVFVEGLRKVCTEGGHFERVIENNILRLLKDNKAFINMYLAFRQHREKVAGAAGPRVLLEEEPSLFASHPTFRQRREAAARLPAAPAREDAAALSLFDHPEEVERELTDFLTRAIAARRR